MVHQSCDRLQTGMIYIYIRHLVPANYYTVYLYRRLRHCICMCHQDLTTLRTFKSLHEVFVDRGVSANRLCEEQKGQVRIGCLYWQDISKLTKVYIKHPVCLYS